MKSFDGKEASSMGAAAKKNEQRFSYANEQLALLNVNDYKSLIDCFEESCAKYADRRAYSCLGHELSFAELEEHSRDFAAYLTHGCGLSRGDRVAIQLPNICQYPIVAWGVLRAGMVIVNTNPLYTLRELEHQFNDSGAKAIVVLADLLPSTEKVVANTGIEKVIVTHGQDLVSPNPLPAHALENVSSLMDVLLEGKSMAAPDVESSMADTAVLQYTGGTTGVSKGAVLSQGNLFSSYKLGRNFFGYEVEEGEVVIAPMPLYHVYGFTMSVISTCLGGGLSVLIPNPRDLDSLIDEMKTHRAHGFAGVNTLFQGMMMHPEFDQIDFSELNGAIAGGTALIKEIGEEWYERTGTQICEGYGLSETAAALTCNSIDHRQLGTVGMAFDNMEVKVINEAGDTLAIGEEGELLVRGPQVMQGYWQRPEATDEALDEDGWFRTGDVVIIQEDSYIRIVDRLKDMIIVSGFNVYPNEVEAVIYAHPDVVECAAVGIKDNKTGEAIKLFVVSSNPDLSAADLQAFCGDKLTRYKIPKSIEFKEDLPKSNVGKILRRELRNV